MDGIILRLFLVYILNGSAVSIDDGFSTRSEMLICLNHMVLIYFGHCSTYGGPQIFYSFMETLIDYALYVVAQRMQVWRARNDVTRKIVTYET